MRTRGAFGLAAAATMCAACGAAGSKPAESAQAPAAASEYAPDSPGKQAGSASPVQAQPAAPSPPPAPAAHGPGRSERIRAFYSLGVELDQAGPDCRAACRALGAMDRAAGELCDVDGHDGVCKDAEGRVRDARDRVRTSCGTCPDGVVLDRAAPVPASKLPK